MTAILRHRLRTQTCPLLAGPDIPTLSYVRSSEVSAYGTVPGSWARLHNDAGVKDKFHPDELEIMWARAAKALDPHGDGR
jgi:hypothetical protein